MNKKSSALFDFRQRFAPKLWHVQVQLKDTLYRWPPDDPGFQTHRVHLGQTREDFFDVDHQGGAVSVGSC
jgi:hypothetical protein